MTTMTMTITMTMTMTVTVTVTVTMAVTMTMVVTDCDWLWLWLHDGNCDWLWLWLWLWLHDCNCDCDFDCDCDWLWLLLWLWITLTITEQIGLHSVLLPLSITINNGNKTEWTPVRSVIIRVMESIYSRVWLQTDWEQAKSCYQLIITVTISEKISAFFFSERAFEYQMSKIRENITGGDLVLQIRPFWKIPSLVG